MQRKQAATTRRPRFPMPDDIRTALLEADLWSAYQDRPPYQRNDYIGWITRARKPDTRTRRMSQMLEELKAGDRYMKMAYRARRGS